MYKQSHHRQQSHSVGWLLLAAGAVLGWGWLQGTATSIAAHLSVACGGKLLYGEPVLSGMLCATSVAAFTAGAVLLCCDRSDDDESALATAAVTPFQPNPPLPVQEAVQDPGMRIDVVSLHGFIIGGTTGEVASYVVGEQVAVESPWAALTAGARQARLAEAATTNPPRFIVHHGKVIPLHTRGNDSDVIARIGSDDCEPLAA